MRACCSLLGAIKEGIKMPELLVDFSRPGGSLQLNKVLMNVGITGILEGKHHRSLDMCFQVMGSFVEGVLQRQEMAAITNTNKKFRELSNMH